MSGCLFFLEYTQLLVQRNRSCSFRAVQELGPARLKLLYVLSYQGSLCLPHVYLEVVTAWDGFIFAETVVLGHVVIGF